MYKTERFERALKAFLIWLKRTGKIDWSKKEKLYWQQWKPIQSKWNRVEVAVTQKCDQHQVKSMISGLSSEGWWAEKGWGTETKSRQEDPVCRSQEEGTEDTTESAEKRAGGEAPEAPSTAHFQPLLRRKCNADPARVHAGMAPSFLLLHSVTMVWQLLTPEICNATSFKSLD